MPWHKNNPDNKPSGRVLIIRDGDGPCVAEWYGVYGYWHRVPGGYSLQDEFVTHWHEIPPFDGETVDANAASG